MQTILGSGGAIGTELARALPAYTDTVRLVSRSPSRVNPGDVLMATDLTNKEAVNQAVAGSEVAYLTVGLTYDTKVWETSWPLIVDNVIEACKAHGCKLVFFDNVYMYHPDTMGNMTEGSLVDPVSRKGRVRARLADKIQAASKEGSIRTLIARSADFYGPSIKDVSLLTESVLKPLSQGKKAQCLGRMDVEHSFTYTPDAGKATALLGNTDDAYGEVWHLPTASDPYTMKQWVEIVAGYFGVPPKYLAANKFIVRLIGLFVPIMKEMSEMMYQYDRDYIFVSDKFQKRFNWTPTSYQEGIEEVLSTNY